MRSYAAPCVGIIAPVTVMAPQWTLLTQPGVAVTVGWFVFGEALAPLDFAGMALIGAALVLARLGDQSAFRGMRAASTGG